MKTLEEFARAATEQNATIAVGAAPASLEDFLQPDALLQTPLIAFCLLLMAFRSRRGIDAGHTASVTSAIFASYFAGLGDARSRLAWSPAMRRKCADALADLEAMSLVSVAGLPRRFSLTESGMSVVTTALREPRSEIGMLARGLRRAYDDVENMGLDLL